MEEAPEVLFGGAAGGGKSDAMLMAALQYVHVPRYSALILRRTYPQLAQEGGLIPRSHEWLAGKAVWNEQKKSWRFPSGAVLAFGHMQHESTKYDYQSGEYQFVGFEELTQFTETQYLYMHSRTRRLEGADMPIRIRATSNPGGLGHDWVRMRFIDSVDPTRRYIPSGLDDNPSLDREAYVRSMLNLDPVTREQLLRGDWSVRPQGGAFRREWFQVVDAAPAQAKRVRYWDLAASPRRPGTDPDWTVGARLAWLDGVTYVEDIRRVRLPPGGVESLVRQTADLDGQIPVWMEQEPGSAGVNTIDYYRRKVLPDRAFGADRVTGDKVTRAMPFAAQAEAGNVKLVRGSWNQAFLDEVELFPYGAHDDQVDACSGAYNKLAVSGRGMHGF